MPTYLPCTYQAYLLTMYLPGQPTYHAPTMPTSCRSKQTPSLPPAGSRQFSLIRKATILKCNPAPLDPTVMQCARHKYMREYRVVGIVYNCMLVMVLYKRVRHLCAQATRTCNHFSQLARHTGHSFNLAAHSPQAHWWPHGTAMCDLGLRKQTMHVV